MSFLELLRLASDQLIEAISVSRLENLLRLKATIAIIQVVSSEFVCKTEAHRCSSSLNNKKEGIGPLFYYSIFFLIFSFALSISLILFSIVETCFFRAFLSVLTSLY